MPLFKDGMKKDHELGNVLIEYVPYLVKELKRMNDLKECELKMLKENLESKQK